MQDKSTKEATNSIQVVIGHPHSLLLEGIARILVDAGFTVLKKTTKAKEILKASIEYNPQIVILHSDISNPRLIKKLGEETRSTVVVLTTPEDKQGSAQAIEAGAKGYLTVAQKPAKFIQSLTLLAQGDMVVAKEATQPLQETLDKGIGAAADSELTDRELDVATLIAKGATNREIADKLMVSQHTVKIHLHNILNKLDLRNRQQIATYVTQQGIVEDISTEDFL
jgi:DNA-binding NarL/FixJ family response regulator